ncbi:MAG: hypothetical protein HQ596_07130 [Candidatus Saganbacteria bacterium]|nr:hypothetical protein [Candidatus Saganbacteria bacterium]
MNKIVALTLSILLLLTLASFAAGDRQLFGGLDGYIQLETDYDNPTPSANSYKSSLQLQTICTAGTVVLTPFYNFEHDATGGPLNTTYSEIDNEFGCEAEVFSSPMTGVTVSLSYKFVDKPGGNSDDIINTKLKLDF